MSYESDDPSVMLRYASQIVQQHFPTAELLSMTALKGGVFNATFLLLLTGGEKTVLHIAPKQDKLFSYEKYLMSAEKQASMLCAANGVPVPKILFVDESMMLIDRAYMLSEYIPAVSLNQMDIPNTAKEACYEEAGRAIRRLHNIKGARFGRLAHLVHGKGFDKWSEALLYEVEVWKEVAKPAALFPERVFTAIDSIFQAHTALLDQITIPHLVHGDLWSGNLLASMEAGVCRFRAIIDMDHALWGDSEYDFSGKMLNDAFARGYGSRLLEYEEDADSFVRRKLYLLYYSIKQCYKYQCLHNDLVHSNIQRRYIDQLLLEFA